MTEALSPVELAIIDAFTDVGEALPAANRRPDRDKLRHIVRKVTIAVDIKASHVYELLARAYGFRTWSAMCASYYPKK